MQKFLLAVSIPFFLIKERIQNEMERSIIKHFYCYFVYHKYKLQIIGASDDGAGCAVMMEILRVISKSDKILRHNIIFLFNGGEENFMPASHGFITQHKWAQEVIKFQISLIR